MEEKCTPRTSDHPHQDHHETCMVHPRPPTLPKKKPFPNTTSHALPEQRFVSLPTMGGVKELHGSTVINRMTTPKALFLLHNSETPYPSKQPKQHPESAAWDPPHFSSKAAQDGINQAHQSPHANPTTNEQTHAQGPPHWKPP